MKIEKNMTFAEILEKNENAAEILSKRGFHCIGCMMASSETLEQGAKVHGLSEEETDELVEELSSSD